MLNITRLPLGVYQTNCYIIREEASTSCCVLDPGGEAKKVLEFLNLRNLTLDAILLTHGHFDHVGAVAELREATGCKVYLCPEDLTMPAKWTGGELCYTNTYGEGDALDLAGAPLRLAGEEPLGKDCSVLRIAMPHGAGALAFHKMESCAQSAQEAARRELDSIFSGMGMAFCRVLPFRRGLG